MNPAPAFPRVTIPDVDPEKASYVRQLMEEAEANASALRRNRRGMAEAMRRLGYRPYLGHVFRKPKATKHVRMKARLAARSTKGVTA